MLEVRSVSRCYGDFKAVDDVSFTVSQGEIVGLLGHNGAGKTTIMKMLSGYLEPDSGTIAFRGKPLVDNSAPLQQELGYLPENLPVYPELSVASYLDYAAELKGISGMGKRRAIQEALDATDLSDRLLSSISTLSRGLKQRVGVAQAILGQPSLLILDEPTNGLDPAQTESMRALIRRLSESATVILSTHIMQEVEAICDRALIVRQGRVAVDASLAQLQKGSGIRLHCQADTVRLRELLGPCRWFAGLTESASEGGFLVALHDGNVPEESIADALPLLVNAGISVHGIAPNVQDLQSLFLALNDTETRSVGGQGSSGPDAAKDKTDKEIEHVA